MKLKIATLVILAVTLFAWRVEAATPPPIVDSDNDGLSDQDEITIYRTDPWKADTDGDGYPDGVEIKAGYSPLVKGRKLRDVDTDRDGLWDDWEIALGTDLTNPDTDGDRYPDGVEVRHGYDPRSNSQQKLAKRIWVSLKEQRLTYSLGDKTLDSFLISSGLPKTPTPPGDYTVLMKKPVVHYKGPGFDFPNTKWNLMFKRRNSSNFYIHGAYWHHDFGKTKSHGCVNAPYDEAHMGRLYDWADVGTPVVIEG